MTETYYTTTKYKQNHSAFSGELTIEDFSTYSPNKKRINNQIDADNLYETIKNKQAKKIEEEKYKSMTLEELKELKLISNTNGRPSSSMTDEKWQKEFNIRKILITPYDKSIRKLRKTFSRESEKWNEETMGTYHGCTNWQQYCSYINDVLNNIRSGQVDYCYYIYQIFDLLKFHYDDLQTRYCDGYWEVWLER